MTVCIDPNATNYKEHKPCTYDCPPILLILVR